MAKRSPRESSTLWTRVLDRTERAIRRGSLHSIPTRGRWLPDAGVDFFVRIVSNLARKDDQQRGQKRAEPNASAPDPFLPYEPDMFVADLLETHVCLLNKFNVVEHHVLIVTRAFEHQQTPLTSDDFEAAWVCLLATPGLVFYNAGEVAGASQPHKHLQMIPLPVAQAAGGHPVPIEALLAAASFDGPLGTVAGLPFDHRFARLESSVATDPRRAARLAFDRYRRMIRALALQPAGQARTHPYNLLATREWLLVVPRSQERYEGISINALGFAGALLVRDEQQLSSLEARGPMTALRAVAPLRR